MKQLLQDRRSGEIRVVEVPAPAPDPNRILVGTRASLISTGTERSTVSLGEKSLLGKARARPDLVRKVVDSVQSKGLADTVQTVRARLAEPSVLGYSSAGVVLEVGEAVEGFSAGDRVACCGQGIASHAEVNSVPANLAVPIPEEIGFDEGAFVALGSIAMHGVRTSGVTFGDHVAVIGLGLIGLITVQLLRAAGCRVYGMDLDPSRAELARRLGCDDVATGGDELEAFVRAGTDGRGADAVLLTASTRSDDPVRLAGALARDRGTVCVVGDVGLTVPREPYYMKELSFLISRSYGPGRYDPAYELLGQRYPTGFVPWDQRRNMQAFLEMIARGQVSVAELLTDVFEIDDAPAAYARITGRGDEPAPIAVLLRYGDEPSDDRVVRVGAAGEARRTGDGFALIGAGNFATATLLPRFRKDKALVPKVVVTRSGHSATSAAEAFGFEQAATTPDAAIDSPDVDIVVIATRHDSHASLSAASLRAGKAVFVEKPLAIDLAGLAELDRAVRESGNDRLMVGFNRRFSSFGMGLREHFPGGPEAATYRVNAGALPHTHWTRDPAVGGGRMIGEGCHFIDFLSFLFDGRVAEVHAHALTQSDGGTPESVQLNLSYEGGQMGQLLYVGTGDTAMPKERVEAFGRGRSGSLDNFRRLELWSGGKSAEQKARTRIDKGFEGEVAAFLHAARSGGPMPIAMDSLVNTTLATFAAGRSLAESRCVSIAELDAELSGMVETG